MEEIEFKALFFQGTFWIAGNVLHTNRISETENNVKTDFEN